MALPDESAMKGYSLYPVVVDNLIQLAAAFLEHKEDAGGGLFLPVGMDAVTVFDLSKMALVGAGVVFGKTTLTKAEGVSFVFGSVFFDASGEPILKVLGLRLMKVHQSMFVKGKGSGDVAVAAEAPMYDVEWSESNAEGDGPQQSDAATLFVTDDASTATATGALMNCTSILAKNWSSVEAVVNADSTESTASMVNRPKTRFMGPGNAIRQCSPKLFPSIGAQIHLFRVFRLMNLA
jgi:hypothetical protein